MELDLSTLFVNLPLNGKGCKIAVFDDAAAHGTRELASITDNTEHVRRITGFLAEPALHGFATQSQVLSVNFWDCLSQGYDVIKPQIVAEHGPIAIEAHAYSVPASALTEKYEQQIANIFCNPVLRSLMICSPGHDDFRVRFPATSSHAVTVGLLRADGGIIGAGLGNLLTPAILINDMSFPAFDQMGNLIQVSGTSPAVTFVAGVAALLHEHLLNPREPEELYAALLLLTSPCQKTYLLNRFEVLHQNIIVNALIQKKGCSRRIKLAVKRTEGEFCRLSVLVNALNAPHIVNGHRSSIEMSVNTKYEELRVIDNRLMFPLDQLTVGEKLEIALEINGLSDAATLAWTGADIEVLFDEVTPIKLANENAVIGISASHDASVVLLLGTRLIVGIQLERITRIKHDGLPVLNIGIDQAIQYCLDSAGLDLNEIDTFSFNIQALTPAYVGLSQPVAKSDFRSFDPFGSKSLYISHHLCHAFAGYSGSKYDNAKVVVFDGSGGVTSGSDDLIMVGSELKEYIHSGDSSSRMKLHTFSLYDFNRRVFKLNYREYAPSFNVRSGSSSLGEAYAAVSQFVFGSWQDSGKLMGLAPYGKALKEDSYLQRGIDGELNFTSNWKHAPDLNQSKRDIMDCANLAARIQQDLEIAIIDRFQRHVGSGKDVVFTGGIALNSVVNHHIRTEIAPSAFYLLPAQHDAGVAIGAAAAALYHSDNEISSSLFNHDFLGHCYNERDVALAINLFADRLTVRRTDKKEVAERIAAGEVFGFFSLQKGSEFGPRALGARSILADPRNRSSWSFVNKWVKYREEFRPFAPMVIEEELNSYFDAIGSLPYMLEVVKVRKEFRDSLAAITHVDGSARVQTVSSEGDPYMHSLLCEFKAVTGFPILLNTSFNVRGQPIVEKPQHALEMLLSTQLNAVLFDNLLVEIAHSAGDIEMGNKFLLSPGTSANMASNEQGVLCTLNVKSQGKKIKIQREMFFVLQLLNEGATVAEALASVKVEDQEHIKLLLNRFYRLRFLNKIEFNSNSK